MSKPIITEHRYCRTHGCHTTACHCDPACVVDVRTVLTIATVVAAPAVKVA